MELSTSEQAAITSGGDFWSTEAIESAGIPAVTVTDGPHGVRMQASGGDLLAGVPATCFPPAVAGASTWDPELLHRMGRALGDECRAQDVAVLLGPGVNLKRSPLGGRNFEYFSEDPILTGVLATAWVRGLQSRGVGASLKHFAVNNQETDRMRISADVDERTLREMYLRAFQKVVTRAQPWTVMCAYNKINGVYASEHHWLLTEVLRGEWGFEGLVVSDWGAVVDRVRAVAAGLDLTMPGPDAAGDRALADAVEAGRLDARTLRLSAERVRKMIEKAGERPAGSYDAEAHHALAREIAARAIVLLKNDGDLLPLGENRTLAVLGEFARTPRYQGGGSSQITPTRLDDALTEITASTGAEVAFAAGYTTQGDPDERLLDEAVAVAAGKDVAIVFVGSVHETEGADRESIDLPAAQLALIERVAAVNPRTIVVLSNGAVLATKPWDENVPALLEGWLLGQAGGSAIADVLFGRVNPSGRLAETIPVKLADHPSYLDFPGEHGHVRYGEGLHVGYRGFDARGQEVAYPFGFGLSYTTFGYGAVQATATAAGVEVGVPVTNTGGRDGREVVQAYVSLPGSRVRRAPRELKAFASVPVTAGDTVEARLVIERADLAYWDTRLGRWIVEGGEYLIEVGSSSRDVRASVTVRVACDPARVPLTRESSVGEWLADPRGAEVLGAAFAAAAGASDGPTAAMTANPEVLMMLGSLPLSRMASFPGSPLNAGDLDKMVEAAN
ncbi:glycoside hydrolase family 3 C-terminal domain-containing protein [Actinoplanes sp. NEAU-A12]|uniref:Glycoside hydrolase family 3 C-terminal domain-containing protein n=1 Tax=Actinoplanes sandaracinus TaxID=3045177 RepID=A0ABT6WRX6_9ACTN|nr:glycoside hydrolase family 3 C-terminal domain-containing protein [Actinoplanes sandaracinus]MDI6102497.1 glycoside hydrolase family 3 C-terminal domain-containing protein [Actinoplanes sandaracinus]